MPFPESLAVAVLNTFHPTRDPEWLEDLWCLYRNRIETDEVRKRFLAQRAFEADDLYKERIRRFHLCSYLGEITDFFVAGLFLDAPRGLAEDEGSSEKDYWEDFFSDADGKGGDLQKIMRGAWVRALVYGRSYLWAELPPAPAQGAEPRSRAEQDQQGLRDAYLISLSNEEILDWEEDEMGELIHAWIGQCRIVRPDPAKATRMMRLTWTLLTRTEFARYQAEVEAIEKDGVWKPKISTEELGKLVVPKLAEGAHTFGRVPLIQLDLPEGLRLGPKIENQQRHLIEADNAIGWKHFQGNYAMPVVKTESEFKQTMGEAYFIKLNPGDEFDWSEPAGATLAMAHEDRERCKTELFRVSHQLAASVGAEASTAGRSGESKRRDMTPTLVVLSALGELARDFYETTIQTIAAGRGEKTEGLAIAGFSHFDIEELGDFLDSVIKARTVNVPSVTFQRTLAKKVASRMLPELTPEEAEKVRKEIDAAPDEAFSSTYDPANPNPKDEEDDV